MSNSTIGISRPVGQSVSGDVTPNVLEPVLKASKYGVVAENGLDVKAPTENSIGPATSGAPRPAEHAAGPSSGAGQEDTGATDATDPTTKDTDTLDVDQMTVAKVSTGAVRPVRVGSSSPTHAAAPVAKAAPAASVAAPEALTLAKLAIHDAEAGQDATAAAFSVIETVPTSDLILTGTPGDDDLEGGAGDDRISGLAGDDVLVGDDGDDTLDGGKGDDILIGGDGDDSISGGEGDDVLVGGPGHDVLDGGADNDRLVAGEGDIVLGGAGNDRIELSTDRGAPASIDGGDGDDTLVLGGTGTGSLFQTVIKNVEHLVVAHGDWELGASQSYVDFDVKDGARTTDSIFLTGSQKLVVEQGGTVGSGFAMGVLTTGTLTGASIDNAGTITGIYYNYFGPVGKGPITIVNRATGVIEAPENSGTTLNITGALDQTAPAIDNFGKIIGSDHNSSIAIEFETATGRGARIVNEAGGLISTAAYQDIIRGGAGTVVENHGTIRSYEDQITEDGEVLGGGDAIDYKKKADGTVHNYAGGLIEGSHHAVTGKKAVTVVNDEGGTMIGRNGSAVNIDNDASVASTVHVTNRGTLIGASAGYEDSDGDAIDTDGLAAIENWGTIKATGANGYHNGYEATDANVSEAIAIGGGTIVNHVGGTIYGHGRAVQIDDSSNGPAFAATVITNDGTIEGGGHGPTGVADEHAAIMQAKIDGAEAIDIIGTQADTITNSATGTIIGGIFTDGGDDKLTNDGTITALKGSAVNLGDGNDTLINAGTITGNVILGAGDDMLELENGSTITGSIDGGAGDDTLVLSGTGTGSLAGATVAGIEHLVVESGDWTLGEGPWSFASVDVRSGAVLNGPLIVNGSDLVTVEAGGSVTSKTVGIAAVLWSGAANGAVVDNFGTISGTTAECWPLVAFSNNDDNSVLPQGTGSLTLANHAGATLGEVTLRGDLGQDGAFTLDNAGTVTASGFDDLIDLEDTGAAHVSIVNRSSGVIENSAAGTLIKLANTTGATIVNAGTIRHLADVPGDSSAQSINSAIDYKNTLGVTITNLDGGWIEGSHHGITGKDGVTVVNEAGGTIIGRNGSAVNIDNSADPVATVYVSNHGTLLGQSAGYSDSDGDAIDTDGLAVIENWGSIKGLGANGMHKGEPNISEGIAIGGGSIVNHEGGTIYGYGRAIQVDNSSNGNAFAATAITNQGTIEGGGHGAEGVPDFIQPPRGKPIPVVKPDLTGREAISLIGNWNDTLTNAAAGKIIGGVDMGGGDDTLTNAGSITATGGNAVTLGDGDDTLINFGTITGNVILGAGKDTLELDTGSTLTGTVDGGTGDDTLVVGGTGSGSLASTKVANVEHLVVAGGDWALGDTSGYVDIAVKSGAHTTASIVLTGSQKLVVDAGAWVGTDDALGVVSSGNLTGASIDNSGTIQVIGLVKSNSGQDAASIVNRASGVIANHLQLTGDFTQATAALDNYGQIIGSEGGSIAVDFESVTGNATGNRIVNEAGASITAVAYQDVIRGGTGTVVENHGTISSYEDRIADDGEVLGGGDAIDYKKKTGGLVHNFDGGWIEGSHHAVTGKNAITVINDAGGTLIGRNGSAVNIDNKPGAANTVYVTNHGTMEGRSANYSDSDGDAIDTDGLASVENWGQIKGLGANGYHDGYEATDANISEAIAIGGGTIVNHVGGTIYGHGRAIQVDNSSNGPAFAATVITNDGTIEGGGHGPTGVADEHAAIMQAKIDGAEAIDIIGTQADTITNSATGAIIGGIFTDGGDDNLTNAGAITALHGSAVNLGDGNDTLADSGTITGKVDMGAGADTVTLQAGAEIHGTIRLGDGNDILDAAAVSAAIDVVGGDGNDTIATGSGDDIIDTGNGDDIVHAGAGNDVIKVGTGNDVIDGGDGHDILDLTGATAAVTVDFKAGTASGDGIGTDHFTGIEEVRLGAFGGQVTAGDGDDTLIGGAGNTALTGGAGNDTLIGGTSINTLSGGSGDDTLTAGAHGDQLAGGSGNDLMTGGVGDDSLSGGSGNDTIGGAAGDDLLTGGSGADNFVFAPNFGKDTISDFAAAGASHDLIVFDHATFGDFAAAIEAAAQVGTDVVFTVDDHTSLTLANTQLSSLSADDFRFS